MSAVVFFSPLFFSVKIQTRSPFLAQRWADQCQFGHDIERGVSRFTVGQNVHEQSAFNDDAVDFKRAIDGWYNEVSAFDNSDADDYQ